jgi:hypothetical protein
MKTFDSHAAAREAIMDFRADDFPALEDRFKARFKELAASPAPVDSYVNIGEFIYANRADMTDEAKALAAGLLAFSTANAWYGLLEDSRGDRMVANLRKDIGEIKSAPAAPDPREGMLV